MLHEETKKRAFATLDKAFEKRDVVVEAVETECARLYQTRKRAIELIVRIEAFVNSRASTPKEFTPTLARIDIERTNFRKTEDYAAEAEKPSWHLAGM